MAPGKKAPTQQSTLFSFFKKKPSTEDATSSSEKKEVITENLAIKKNSQDNVEKQKKELVKKEAENVKEEQMDIDDEDDETPTPRKQNRSRKRVSYKESDEDEEDPVEEKKRRVVNPFAAGKKRKLVRRISDDDSDDNYDPKSAKDTEKDDDEDDAMMVEEEEEDEDVAPKNIPVTPLADKFQKFSMSSPARPTTNAFSMMKTTSKAEKRQERTQKFKEKNDDRYQWLQNQKDLQGNPIGSSEYDPRTLYIPQSAWNQFTPFEKQYWEVKHKHWDTVVFFKKGKFYELYEKDADIGHKDFDLKMTDRVNMRMVGVPEGSFDYWTAQFIAKGHKVARVDQMETAIGKSMREKGDAKKAADKVIRRELTSVLTAGTLVDSGLLTDDLSTYCMSIKEFGGDDNMPPRFGICFVDTATAQFNLVHFEDDMHRTKFETLIMQIKPRELITEKSRLSKTTTRMLKSLLNAPLWNMLIPETEFWSATVTEDELTFSDYFGEEGETSNMDLAKALTEARKDPLLMSSFGAMIWYLRSLKLDRELLSAKNVMMYDPIRNATSLVLDGQTLANLEIFQNSHDGSTEGTVFKLLANSITPFGKRLFKQWLCHPLRNIDAINARLDAVEDLMQMADMQDTIAKYMAKMTDLERLISRIHSGRIKVKEFLATLSGFKTACDIINTMTKNRAQYKSVLLGQLIDQFPKIEELLDNILNSFITAEVDVDYQKLKTIIPNNGTNEEWDDIIQKIQDLENEFNQHLKDVKKQLKCAAVTYKDLGKDIYQLEIPKSEDVPNDWIQVSSTTKVARYYNRTTKCLVEQYKEMLETKNAFVKKFALEVYASFDKSYTVWLSAVQKIAEIDALMGLAKGSMSMGEPACRPVLLDQEKSVIEFEELRHPCVIPGIASDFIPNDVGLGGKDASVVVLTGPNMGGKSTLLRQTCVAIILAQLGGYVPAKSCRLTPCDRIYTRIGANDNIMGGQSTFMVELTETSKILREATPRSMVILDELGRGTSTFDGYSIAYSVLHYLSTHIGCLCMFATHYHTLCKEFERCPEINNMHMGYIMDEGEHNVTFLYKLTAGICAKSFGMNVAMMAGLPQSIVERATTVAEETEIVHKQKDTTYANDKDNFKITPAVISDLAYLFSDRPKHNSMRRIINSFKNLY